MEVSLEGDSDSEEDFAKKIEENRKIIQEVKKKHAEQKENQWQVYQAKGEKAKTK